MNLVQKGRAAIEARYASAAHLACDAPPSLEELRWREPGPSLARAWIAAATRRRRE